MRRWGVVGVALVLAVTAAACDVLRDAFSAHADAAARAAGQTLTVERLAGIASQVKGRPLDQATLTRLVNVYVDYTLFAMALARGENLEDSALVARTMWPVVSQMKFDRFVERLAAGHAPGDRDIDTIYAAGELRAFEHILVVLPPNAAPPVVQQKQATITRLWRSLAATGGANFAAVAKSSSEDPGSKASGGYLGVGGRKRFTPSFEEAAWKLSPGAMSGVVQSNFGFHVIRRPSLREIRDSFAAGVRRVTVERFDSTYMSDLATQHNVRVLGGAGEAIRNAVPDLDRAGRSTRPIASYRGGEFRMKDLVRWLYALDPRLTQQLPAATDSQIGGLVLHLAERVIALQQAESAAVQLSDSEWGEVRTEYDSSLTILKTVLNLNPAVLRDSSTTPDGRARLAMQRLDDYFDRLMGGRAQFFAVPPLLAQALRERNSWSIDASGIRQATERVIALRAAADSLSAPGGGNPGATLRPAPGPAPIPAVPESVLRRPPTQRTVQ
jgi:hypothetical protein